MKKIDFFRMLNARDHFNMHIFDYWADWREEQGLKWDVDDLDFNYEPIYENTQWYILVRTPIGDDKIPAEYFFEKPNEEEPQMLWHSDYYDGPISGIARYKGQIVWFNCVEWEHDNLFFMRRYALYELTQEQIDHEIEIHNRFRRQVGRHCDYCDDFWNPNDEKISSLQPIMNLFYEWFKKTPRTDYTKNKVLGIFDDSQFTKERDRRHDLRN